MRCWHPLAASRPQDYQAWLLLQIPSIQEDADKWAPVLKRICWYVVLAPADSDQVTLLNTTAADKKLEELPEYKELLQTLIVKEVGL